MRKFLVSINGNQYEVGVEEVGVTASAPVVTHVQPAVSQPKAAAPKRASDMA